MIFNIFNLYFYFIEKYIYIYPRGPRFSDGEAVGLGGVGWGMVASCYVAATFMGGVGWGGAW